MYLGRGVTLYLGDHRDVIDYIPSSASLVTDPPYGIGFVKGATGRPAPNRSAANTRRSTRKIVGDDEPHDPSPFERFNFRLSWGANHYCRHLQRGRWLAWDKTGGGRGPRDSFSDVELAWCSSKGADKIFHYLWKGICQDGEKGQKRQHPLQKPIALMEWCVGLSPPDSLVCDPYMGAGSTGIAAVRQGRPFVGMEVDPEYFHRAYDRIWSEVKLKSAARG